VQIARSPAATGGCAGRVTADAVVQDAVGNLKIAKDESNERIGGVVARR
jgi:hypothetical protein